MEHAIPSISLHKSTSENCVPFCNFATFKNRIKALFAANNIIEYRFSDTPINGAEKEPTFIYKSAKTHEIREYPKKQKIYLIAKVRKEDLLLISREIGLWTKTTDKPKSMTEKDLNKELKANCIPNTD